MAATFEDGRKIENVAVSAPCHVRKLVYQYDAHGPHTTEPEVRLDSPIDMVAARYMARQLLGADARTMPIFGLFSEAAPDRIVGKNTQVCIEGFPRSGNSWAVFAFREWNPNTIIAHHAHVPGQLGLAAKLGVPAAIVIREPVEAVTSFVVYTQNRVSPSVALWAYRAFHDRAARVRNEVVVCKFDDVVSDPGILVRRLNARFDTDFASGEVDDEFRATVVRRLRRTGAALGADPVSQVSLPAAEREELKVRVRASVLKSRHTAGAMRSYERLVTL